MYMLGEDQLLLWIAGQYGLDSNLPVDYELLKEQRTK